VDLVVAVVIKVALAELEMQVVIVHLKEITVEHLAVEIMADLAVAELALSVITRVQELLAVVAMEVTDQQIQ
tara:strand:- start:251 stop:466 length:216 start_codon:yes stop_codon:yes gene_type:complete